MNKGIGNPVNTKSNCPWTSYWNKHFSDGLNWRELPWGEQRAAGMAAAVVMSLTAGSSPLGSLTCLVCNLLFQSDDEKTFQYHMTRLGHLNKMNKFEDLKKKLTAYFAYLRRQVTNRNIFDGSVLAMEVILGEAGLENLPEAERKHGLDIYCKLCKVNMNKGSKVSHLLGQRHVRACSEYVDDECLKVRSLEGQGRRCGSTVPMRPWQPPPAYSPAQLIPIALKPATCVRESTRPGTSTTTPAVPSSSDNKGAPQSSSYASPMSDPRLISRKVPNIIRRPPPQQPARPAAESAPRSSSTPPPSVPRPASSVRAPAAPPLLSVTVPNKYGNAAPGTTADTTSVADPRMSRLWDASGPAQPPGFYRPQAVQPPPGLPVQTVYEIHTISGQEARPTSQNIPEQMSLDSEFSNFFSTTDDGTTSVPPVKEVVSRKNESIPKLGLFSSARRPFPFLAFDEIIGFVLPQEASDALDLLLKRSLECYKYQTEKYVRADCHVKGHTFTAIGRTEDEAKNKAAREALKFLKRNAAPLNAKA